jgi:isopentenyl-diphosphate delta-isomerase
MSEKFIIVNENDEIIGIKERRNLDINKDFFRVSALNIYNSKGEILLAKRSKNKKLDAGKWGPAVAGTNEENETYESNIIKESLEEINLNLNDFELKKSVKVKNEGYATFFVQWFIVKIDKDLDFFKKQDEEVEELKWILVKDFEKELEKFPEKFTASMKMHYEAVKNFEKDLFKKLVSS